MVTECPVKNDSGSSCAYSSSAKSANCSFARSDEVDPLNGMPPPNQRPTPDQPFLLSTSREKSNIPKANSNDTWEYPSPQMFWNTMPRKGWRFQDDQLSQKDIQNVNRETTEEAKRRFEVECEFVQCLANPHYLNYLAQRGYFKEKYFINYLKYLLYFKRPEYARTLKFPQCLFFLEALQSSEFREAMTSPQNARYIEDQQLLQWHFYIRKRQRLQLSQVDKQAAAESAMDQNMNGRTDANTVSYLPPPRP